MPRFGRIVLPGLPHHLYQRGHNGRDVFRHERDYLAYLETLAEFRETLELKIYGYCLMTNHVHLIVDPGSHPENVGKLMKRLAGRHTRRINRIETRSGTLWGGRFKSSPIQTDRYMLACLRYVDRNPVRARMVTSAGQYRWSSYREHVGERHTHWIEVDPVTVGFCESEQQRWQRYRDFVAEGDDELELRHIRNSLQRGTTTSTEEFAAALEKSADKEMPRRNRGRPVKAKKKTGAEAPVIVDK
jgi:putative transposase